MMNNDFPVRLTIDEVKAVSKLLGFVLYHKSPELFSVATKLDNLFGELLTLEDYDTVRFHKNNEDGVPIKQYKHNNFSISVEGGK